MHTHFGSATHLFSTFIGVLVAGTFWRLGWMHALAFAGKRGWKFLSGLSRAALAQY